MLDHLGNTSKKQLQGIKWNILCNKPTVLSKINSACTVTLDPFVGIVKYLCSQQTCTSILETKKLSANLWKSIESVHGKTRLKMG